MLSKKVIKIKDKKNALLLFPHCYCFFSMGHKALSQLAWAGPFRRNMPLHTWLISVGEAVKHGLLLKSKAVGFDRDPSNFPKDQGIMDICTSPVIGFPGNIFCRNF